ncbi:sterol desaturase family protein [Candidatus Nanopelagicales bacterium]|nr:sterol desaturase family protein [Candidatus Nanopelagicales bacterium]
MGTATSPWRANYYKQDAPPRGGVAAVFPNGPRTTLAQAFHTWLTAPSAQLALIALVLALVLRIVVGTYTWWDLVVVVALVGFHPMTEWLIHTFILHAKPVKVGAGQYQSLVAREHVRHHKDPKELETIFIPLPVVLAMVTLPWLLLLVPWFNTGLVLTGLTAAFAILTVYEWTHFLIHTPYRPKGRYYRYIRRAHILHHYKNEHYWLGVTVHTADHLLGTFPDKSTVPTSPTAKDLAAR